MTDNDRNLISKAKKLNSVEWSIAELYESQAESEIAKRELRNIAIRLHHREEAFAGII